jgi:CheY-like chemotaxis protein
MAHGVEGWKGPGLPFQGAFGRISGYGMAVGNGMRVVHSKSMNSRTPHPEPRKTGSRPGGRLNLLLSSGWRQGGATDQLPDLLDPLGIQCIHARSGREATQLVQANRIDIALIDLELPMEDVEDAQVAGPRILQLIRRLDPAPPTVVIRPLQSTRRDSSRGLSEALREGAFAVLDRPLKLEAMLETLRRVVRRHYADRWPAA